jgi:hypothetical protein
MQKWALTKASLRLTQVPCSTDSQCWWGKPDERLLALVIGGGQSSQFSAHIDQIGCEILACPKADDHFGQINGHQGRFMRKPTYLAR